MGLLFRQYLPNTHTEFHHQCTAILTTKIIEFFGIVCRTNAPVGTGDSVVDAEVVAADAVEDTRRVDFPRVADVERHRRS